MAVSTFGAERRVFHVVHAQHHRLRPTRHVPAAPGAVDGDVEAGLRLLDADFARGGEQGQHPAPFVDPALGGVDVPETDRDAVHLPHEVVEHGHEAQPHVVPEPLGRLGNPDPSRRCLIGILIRSCTRARQAPNIGSAAEINKYIVCS